MTKQITITLQPLGTIVRVKPGTPLIDVLHDFGVEFPCGGKGTCGRCKVKLLQGELEAGKEQKAKLNKLQLSDEWRLACFCTADSDITLEVAQFENIILADSTTFEISPKEGFGVRKAMFNSAMVRDEFDARQYSHQAVLVKTRNIEKDQAAWKAVSAVGDHCPVVPHAVAVARTEEIE